MRIAENPASFLLLAGLFRAYSQQPPQPVDITPIDGETYYVVNRLSGMQIDLESVSATAGAGVVQQPRTFTKLSQRWTFAGLSAGFWQIGNYSDGQCLDVRHAGARPPVRGHERIEVARGFVVQNPCQSIASQEWALTPTGNGYYVIVNKSTGLCADVSSPTASAGSPLDETRFSGAAAQSQQWLPRPAFFRGVDNALLEKQESDRAAIGLAWWNDAGQPRDVLEILKNHGVNMVRLRPSSTPPYVNVSQARCSGNACYGETESQDLDLAKRAKNLGLSIELTLLFDGGASASVPPAWAGDTELSQLQADLYAYVKAEILSYRQAGAMPDLVAIGNEVDTGFLGAIGSPTGAAFGGFAALQTAAMQAVVDAAADTSAGPSLAPPLTCIHITPAWDLTQFFTLANQFQIPYDAICQSYYPIYHGPLTAAQAAASNPNRKPVEQDVLLNAANTIGKPILILETGEHYEDGFDANDQWYAPPTPALQRQFLLDLQAVQESLPNHLGLGMAYWDPAGVNVPRASGGFVNGDNQPDAIYIWNGLTLFDNADASGSTDVNATNYSALLPGVDALGGKLDPTLSYKLVNLGNGQILSVAAGATLDTEADTGNPTVSQQWRIDSNDDGYFQIASLSGGAASALDDSGASTAIGTAITLSLSGSGQELEWDIVSAGNSYFTLVNRASGMVLDLSGGSVVRETQDSTRTTQQWRIVPVRPQFTVELAGPPYNPPLGSKLTVHEHTTAAAPFDKVIWLMIAIPL